MLTFYAKVEWIQILSNLSISLFPFVYYFNFEHFFSLLLSLFSLYFAAGEAGGRGRRSKHVLSCEKMEIKCSYFMITSVTYKKKI